MLSFRLATLVTTDSCGEYNFAGRNLFFMSKLYGKIVFSCLMFFCCLDGVCFSLCIIPCCNVYYPIVII